MSSLRNRTPTSFRFNPNDEDLLEEVLESEASNLKTTDESLISDTSSIPPNSDPLNASNIASSSPPRSNSMKDFLTSRLNKAKSLDAEDVPKTITDSPKTAKWFNDIKGKIKEKIEEKKAEKAAKRNEISEKDIVRIAATPESKKEAVQGSPQQQHKELHATPERPDRKKKSSPLLSISKSFDDWEHIDSSDLDTLTNNSPTPFLTVETESEEGEEFTPSSTPIPDDQSLQQWSWSSLYYISAAAVSLVAFLISVCSPLPQFVNGLLFGGFITCIVITVLLVFVSKFFIVKNAPELQKKKIRTKRIRKKLDEPVMHKGWMFELLSDYEKRNEVPTRTQLIYVRLQGSNLRLSKPKTPPKKSKLEVSALPVFISQRHYDLSKMRHKRVYLWLPKSVKNQRKYVFNKKYPICVELEDIKKSESIRLVLFIRNCRQKEEWFWRLKEVTKEELINPVDVLIPKEIANFSSGPPTPHSVDKDVISAEIDQLPRAHSVDFGQISIGSGK